MTFIIERFCDYVSYLINIKNNNYKKAVLQVNLDLNEN